MMKRNSCAERLKPVKERRAGKVLMVAPSQQHGGRNEAAAIVRSKHNLISIMIYGMVTYIYAGSLMVPNDKEPYRPPRLRPANRSRPLRQNPTMVSMDARLAQRRFEGLQLGIIERRRSGKREKSRDRRRQTRGRVVLNVEGLKVRAADYFPKNICLYLVITDSEPSEDIPLATVRATVTKTTEIPPPPHPIDPPLVLEPPAPDTPPPAVQPPTSHRKGGRPPNSRKGKLGKNQYTKDRDLQEGDNHSPQRSQSRDVPRADETPHASGNKHSNNEGGKSAKSKNANSKISMGDMRKRVTAILDYISRIQVEMAGESMSPGSAEAAEKTIRGIADGLPMIRVNGERGTEDGEEKKEFKDLSCLEMMDVLTRQLVKWQKEFT